MAITSMSGTNATTATVVDSLLAANSGIAVSYDSIVLRASSADAVNFYDGSLNLGIGAGLLLTSGYAPGTANTSTSDGQDNSGATGFFNGDADIDAVVNTVFQTQSYDATTLAFDFTVLDPNATSISFDIVFGSEEFPEWVDAFVDSAVVIVNGVNYALFNHDPNAPLSVISPNLAAGYFQDNADGRLSIEYDGVSQVLKIVAPVHGGALNSIKIGIADTGDHILDSGIFISNLSAGNIPGSGVVYTDGTGTSGDDQMTGSAKSEYFDACAGNDVVYAGGGDDIVVAGAGNDKVYGGSGADEAEGDAGDDYYDGGTESDTAVYAGNRSAYSVSYDAASGKTTVTSLDDGVDTLVNVEQVRFRDGLFALANGQLTEVVANPTPTNTAGTVAISGKVMAGQTLSAVVIDPDGVEPATVAYEWSVSADGVNWSVAGSQDTLLLGAEAAGWQVKVSASYADGQNHLESPVSNVVTVAQTSTKITVEPMLLSAPAGAGVMDPLTTLVAQASALGYSPTEASLLVKEGLGIDAGINLATYDFYAALSANPDDPQAIAFGKVAGMVAMTASVSDPTGMNLALAVLSAAAQGQALDLTNAADLAAAGLDANAIDFVQPLNQDMTDAGTFAKMAGVWDDWAGQRDNLKSLKGHFDVISIDLNLAPTGFTDAQYAVAADGTLTISNDELIAGFADPDGDALSAVDVQADQGGAFTPNPDGSWTFTPAAGFSGPVELSYLVSDGLASATATALLIVGAGATPANSAPTGAVSISGLAQEDQTLAATNTLDDADGMGSVAYQWYADGAAIGGAVADTFTLTAAEVGKSISVQASYTDGAGHAEAVASGSTAAVMHVNHAATGEVTVTGSAEQNQMLTASNTLADADGPGSVVYQWYADDVAIGGATAESFTLSQAEVNKTISVTASYTDGFGHAESSSSLATLAVANVNDAPGGGIGISGTAQQGQTLSASSTVDDLDGMGTLGYQWLANGAEIVGANGSSYVLTAGEVGKAITVRASYVDGFGTAENVTSAATALVAALAGKTLNGSSKANTLTGTAGDDVLNGLGGNDVLNGGDGSDLLNGGAGTDKMNGGDGSDRYLIEKSADHAAAEIADSGISGVDELRFAATLKDTLTLFAGDTGIERVVIGTGTGATAVTSATTAISINAAAVKNGLSLSGNAGINALTGTAFADTLDGGAGVDTLIGGAGNDTYVVDLTAAGALQDSVSEGGADASDSLVLRGVSTNAGAVTLTLAGALENLDASATGSSALNLTGNAANNSLIGNAAANLISGNAGNDWICGGAGADVLDGGLGNDVFAYGASTQSDRASTDRINNIDFGGADAATVADSFHFDGLAITRATLLNNVSTNAMNTLVALQNTLSFMSSGDAVLMNVTSGVGVGTYLFVDANGQAGYQASGDYAIQLVGVNHLTNFDLSDLTA